MKMIFLLEILAVSKEKANNTINSKCNLNAMRVDNLTDKQSKTSWMSSFKISNGSLPLLSVFRIETC